MSRNHEIETHLENLSSDLDPASDSLAIVLAAGHGKRIKSETSKMLHKIWGVPTVVRVANSAKRGLRSDNQIIVVGIKAKDVAETSGKETNRRFAFQAEQNGTGHAVKIALEAVPNGTYSGDIYIFPGDMGLLSVEAVQKFKAAYHNNPCDMMILTGVFEGAASDNYYGRVLRVPAEDINGKSSGDNFRKVIEIKEQKDILALEPKETYRVNYKSCTYGFTKEDLVNLREFNTGVYVFKADKITTYINKLSTDNVQGELYLTDLIHIFNENDLTVKATEAVDNHTVLGFNVKSVLKEMESYARENVYEKLKDIITIVDQDDFFLADEVVDQIIELDKKKGPLDISIGKGVWIDRDVQLNKGIKIGNHAELSGRVLLDEGVRIQENVHVSAFPGQILKVGRNSEIFIGDIIKGNLEIGENCRIESSVNMTGSDQFPTRIGNNVRIKGTSYVFGSTIEDDVRIEHSVLKCKQVKRVENTDGIVQAIRYFLPKAEGLEAIDDLGK